MQAAKHGQSAGAAVACSGEEFNAQQLVSTGCRAWVPATVRWRVVS